jgi:hypothetical protein
MKRLWGPCAWKDIVSQLAGWCAPGGQVPPLWRRAVISSLESGGIKVAVSGDINEVQLKKYLQQVFLSLPAKSVAVVAKPIDAGKPASHTIVRNEAAPVAVFGSPGPMRADPDYIPAFVANYILGGGSFSARLMDQVRDKRGLTYGIYTQINDSRAASIVVGQVQSDKGKILTAIDVVSGVILVIMMLILGNTIAMGVRERTREYAILRAIGGDRTIRVLGSAANFPFLRSLMSFMSVKSPPR